MLLRHHGPNRRQIFRALVVSRLSLRQSAKIRRLFQVEPGASEQEHAHDETSEPHGSLL
jgi:hypothetical protein